MNVIGVARTQRAESWCSSASCTLGAVSLGEGNVMGECSGDEAGDDAMYEEEVDDHAKKEQPLDLSTHRGELERARGGLAEGAYADARAYNMLSARELVGLVVVRLL